MRKVAVTPPITRAAVNTRTVMGWRSAKTMGFMAWGPRRGAVGRVHHDRCGGASAREPGEGLSEPRALASGARLGTCHRSLTVAVPKYAASTTFHCGRSDPPQFFARA